MPSPALCPRDTKVNKADFAAVMMVLLLTAFLPFIHASDLLRDDYVPCSGLDCGECKQISVSLLMEKQVTTQ